MIRTFTAFQLLLVTALIAAPAFPDKPWAVDCISAILDCRYDRSFSIADSAAAADTCDPLPLLLRLTAFGIRDVDFDTLLDTAAFFRSYRRAEQLIDRYVAKNAPSSYSRMVLGLCRGIHSAYYLRLGSYYTAMQNGFESLDLLDEAWKMDTTNADPLFLPGLYDFARGELKKRLWWVLFWYPGSKERGIERLWRCNRHGVLTGKASLFVLSDIYIRENNVVECAKVLKRLEKDFPKSRFMLWQKIKYLDLRRLYYEAALACELLAASYEKEQPGAYNAFVVRHQQAQMLDRAGQKKDAVRLCQKLLTQPQNRRNKAIYKETEKLLRRLDGRSG
jgi:tetratricopeptide (TPR) repeat protein